MLARRVGANVSPMLRRLASRRLRLRDLPRGTRILVRTALLGAGLAGAVVLLTPFSPSVPGGVIVVARGDHPEVNRIDLVVALLGLTIAFATLGAAAYTRGWRWRRLAVLLLALAGGLIIPAGLNLPEFFPLPMLLARALAYAAVIGLVTLAVIGTAVPRSLVATLAATPVAMSLVSFLGARIGPEPDAVESFVANDIVLGMSALEGLFIVLALWAAVEYSRTIAGAAHAARNLSSAAWLVVGLIVAKLAMFVVTSTDWLPEFLRPADTPWEQLTRDSWLSIVIAALYVGVIGAWLLARNRVPIHGGGSITAAAIIGLPLITPLLLGVTAPQALNSITQLPGVSIDLPTLQSVSNGIASAHSLLLTTAPLLAAILSAVVAAAMLTSRRKELLGVASFLIAFVAWTAVPATAVVLSELAGISSADPGGGVLGLAHPVTLDMALTVLVAILLVARWRGLRRGPSPTILLICLSVTTLIAYGHVVLTGILALTAFWAGIVFPVVVRFGFAPGALNRRSPDREARVLAAAGVASLTLAFTIPMLALGFISPDTVGTGSYFQALMLVPFAAILVGAEIAPSPGEPSASSASSSASSNAEARMS